MHRSSGKMDSLSLTMLTRLKICSWVSSPEKGHLRMVTGNLVSVTHAFKQVWVYLFLWAGTPCFGCLFGLVSSWWKIGLPVPFLETPDGRTNATIQINTGGTPFLLAFREKHKEHHHLGSPKRDIHRWIFLVENEARSTRSRDI